MTMLSLKERCFNVVIDNQGPIVRHASDQLINLPSSLKNNLINKAIFKYEKNGGIENASTDDDLCVFISMLLHADLVKVQFPKLATTSNLETSFCWLKQSRKNFFGFAEDKTKLQLLLEAIGVQCPRLQLLKINFDYIKSPRLEEALFSVLPRLQSLHTLQLTNYCCGDRVLQQISRHCANLLELKVFLDCEVTTAAIETLSELLHLRYFLFDGATLVLGVAKVTFLCSEFLPLLRVVGRRVNVLRFNFFNHNILAQQNQQPKILSLRELHVWNGENPAANIQLPELQAMVLTEPKGAFGMVERFPTITALGLHQLGKRPWDHEEEGDEEQVELVLPILRSVGCRLRCLGLHMHDDSRARRQVMSLHEVLELCPNLECLMVSNCIFNDTCDVWPEKDFSCLEEAYVGGNKCITPMGIQRGHPRGFIFQLLLNAPLKKVIIHDYHVSMREIDQLVKLVSEKRILQNLVSFSWFDVSEKLINTLKAVSPNVEIDEEFPDGSW